MRYILENEKLRVEIDSFGAEIKSVISKADQREYMWCGDKKYWARTSPVLFPFVGSLKNKEYVAKGKTYPMGQHGFARDMEHELLRQSDDTIWFSLKSNDIKNDFIHAIDEILEVVVICVDKVSEAFQLFDSQNTRGKALDPHDLLKAYHLREMKKYPYEMEHAVTKWEAKDTKQIRELFDLYLFPIWNWSRGIKSKSFTANEIDTYKGIAETSMYTYARRASKAMPYFQITEPFIAGNDFFEMVDHYLNLLQDIKTEMENNKSFSLINNVLKQKSGSAGFRYTKNLFYCALLCYYDKFHNFDEMAVKKLFSWAFMVRVDMENLGFDSINKYAIGYENNSRYTNTIAIFSKISFARLHTEVSSLQIKVKRDPDQAASSNWSELYSTIKEINGIMEVSHE